MSALGVAVVIVVLIFLGERLSSSFGGGQSPRAADPTPSSVSALMPTTQESLAGFKLFLSRCKNSPECPYYALSVTGDTLKYVGVRGVARKGVVQVSLSRDRKRQLLALVRKAGFFALDDSYGLEDAGCKAQRMDAPTLKIGVTLNGQTKVVTVNKGCLNVPPRLVALAQGIDRVSRSARWTGAGRNPESAQGG
ncbi:MAG: DUF6438 domain-containing protein [Gammaproteobacteria bacterium]|nr:DUF6438 domain-containing protein [Gammaproteobacteria bacterium]